MTRKLDAAIAEALGYEVIKPRFQDVRDPGGYLHKNVDMWTGDFSYYSTDGNAMLELDAEMRGRGYRRIIFADSEVFSVRYFGSKVSMGSCFVKEGKATSAAMPEAVALAAYKALTGKEWRE